MTLRELRAGALTELEGAVLAVVRREGPCTPYRVRQDFIKSRSREWSGSAGAVYPALQRLEAAGLVAAEEIGDARHSVLYALTKPGKAALRDWISDAEAASGSGLDPFRCRADLFDTLAPGRRALFVRDLTARLQKKCEALKRVIEAGPEPLAAELEFELHRTRLRWLQRRYGSSAEGLKRQGDRIFLPGRERKSAEL